MHPHPASSTWRFPPPRPAHPRRVNLRELAADRARFEHHLVVVARAGDAQLEFAMASEPLPFAHKNRSDEWALPLRTGDPLLDAFAARTFLTDDHGRDVGRYKHAAGDLVLHPFGLAHWPGRLRPPYAPFAFGPGMRRRGLSVVLCGTRDLPAETAPLRVTKGREADVKGDGPRMSLVDVHRDDPGPLATIGDATLSLLVDPTTAPGDGYLLILEGDFDCDLLRVDAGEALPAIHRALFLTSTAGAEPPPESWHRVPAPPFPPAEQVPERGKAPVVRISGCEVPRYWLARTLFRIALHDFQIGWMKTYGDLVLDDRGPGLTIGELTLPRSDLRTLYEDVVPDGYSERT